MFKLISLSLVLLLATLIAAEETSGPTITPFGMAQYRLRLKLNSTKPDGSDETTSMNYRNQIAYFIGTNVKVNDVVSFAFQIGNDATTTEEASFMQQKSTPAWISQAWAKINPGFMNLTFGVLPIKGNGTLDLIERSLAKDTKGYEAKDLGAAQISWPVGTNASLEGIKLGVPVLKGSFKLDIELTQAIIANHTQAEATDPISNAPSIMFLLNLPIAFQSLKITPEIVTILARDTNALTGESDMEFGFGFAGEYKINDKISLTATAAMASHANTNTYSTPDSIAHLTAPTAHDSTIHRNRAKFDYQGVLAGIGGSAKIGPGKLDIDFKYSTNENKEVAKSEASFMFVDLKYGFCMLEQAKKNITIMPRLRLFPSTWETKSKMETRPELIFIGKF